MDVVENKWRVKVILSNGSVLNGVCIGKMNDSNNDVCRALLGMDLPRSSFDPKGSYSSIYKGKDELTSVFFRVGDVSAMEITPLL